MTTPQASGALRVYVSASESREIHSFTMEPASGRLTPLQVIEVPGSGATSRGNMPLAINRERTRLYAEVRIEPYPLSAFDIEPGTGRLQLRESVPMPAPMAYLAIAQDGRHLLSASYDGALIAVHAIDASGRVAAQPLQTLGTPPKAHCIVQAPSGAYVYVASVDGEAILAYRYNADSGLLQAVPTSSARTRHGAGPRHLVFHPAGHTLYCVNEHDGTLGVFGVDRASGALAEVQSESLVPPGFTGNAMSADIHLTPDNDFLYASVRMTDSISAFRVNQATGILTPAGRFTVDEFPRGFAIEPGGRFLLCAGQKSGQVGVYSIDPASGALQLQARYPAGVKPSWIEIIPAA